MTVDEQLAVVAKLKAMGAKSAKVGDLSVEFSEPDSANEDMMQVLEQGIQQGRDEVLRYLSEEQRAQIAQRSADAITYGSS